MEAKTREMRQEYISAVKTHPLAIPKRKDMVYKTRGGLHPLDHQLIVFTRLRLRRRLHLPLEWRDHHHSHHHEFLEGRLWQPNEETVTQPATLTLSSLPPAPAVGGINLALVVTGTSQTETSQTDITELERRILGTSLLLYPILSNSSLIDNRYNSPFAPVQSSGSGVLSHSVHGADGHVSQRHLLQRTSPPEYRYGRLTTTPASAGGAVMYRSHPSLPPLPPLRLPPSFPLPSPPSRNRSSSPAHSATTYAASTYSSAANKPASRYNNSLYLTFSFVFLNTVLVCSLIYDTRRYITPRDTK